MVAIQQRPSQKELLSSLQNPYCLILASILLLALLIAGHWLFNQPALLGHDDALFFSHGIERFSVLEFAPHFPGYPGLIGLGRLALIFTDSAQQALLLVSRLATLLLPLLVCWLLYSAGASLRLALWGGLSCLMQPLLLGLGPLGLSDAPGLAALIATLACWLQRRDTLAGVVLALTLTIRPSYAPLFIGPLLWLCIYQPCRLKAIVLPLVIIGTLALGFIYYHDGTGYFIEGVRFVQGHFQIWGNTALTSAASGNWMNALSRLFDPHPWLSILLITALALPHWLWKQRHNEAISIPASTLIAGLCWTLAVQNPENLRHLAPLLVLLIIVLCLSLIDQPRYWLKIGAILIPCSGLLLLPLQINGSQAPIQQAISFLSSPNVKHRPKLVSSNHGIEILRAALPDYAVVDTFLLGSSNRTVLSGGWLLTSNTMNQPEYLLHATFIARSPAERHLYLYQHYLYQHYTYQQSTAPKAPRSASAEHYH